MRTSDVKDGIVLYWNDDDLDVEEYKRKQKIYFCGKELRKVYADKIVMYQILVFDYNDMCFAKIYSDGSEQEPENVGSYNTEGNPGLTDPENSDYSPSSSSSHVVGNGVDLGSEFDDAFSPNMDFTSSANFISTINTYGLVDQDDYENWEIGAVVFGGETLISPPVNLRYIGMMEIF